jgi:DNA topoisomerase-1
MMPEEKNDAAEPVSSDAPKAEEKPKKAKKAAPKKKAAKKKKKKKKTARKKNLVIVESPAKAKTINKFLGTSYVVKACMGHVRDLPQRNFGIDIENDFEPTYRTIRGKGKTLADLRSAAKKAELVYLAPDPDREGEAIAWHLIKALKIPDDKVRRVTFNSITKQAVKDAFVEPAEIDMSKVNAQQARRLLDRIVGYKLSPLLWKKIGKGLSAGRVQSVAVRLVVEREKEIQAFKPEEYWKITSWMTKTEAEFNADVELSESGAFSAELKKLDGENFKIGNEADATATVDELLQNPFTVTSVRQRDKKDNPAAPLTTSLLQQAASTQLSFSTKKTMVIAQQLYEGIDVGEEGTVGLITYMRTDSFRVAPEALTATRDMIVADYGKEYVHPEVRAYKTKKGAQEAHEAIRPTDVTRTPEALKKYLTDDQYKLYRLIWRRMVASQMASAVYAVTEIAIESGRGLFTVSGRQMKFDGYTRLMGHRLKKDEQLLPEVAEGDVLHVGKLDPTQHFTQPPPRYTEASLVKALEKEGIGRPSTYAPIISTIQDRGYVRQETRKLHATDLGILVTDKLLLFFDDIMNSGFTADLEEKLDSIEESAADWVDVLRTFYDPFEKDLERAQEEMKSEKGQEMEGADPCATCGAPMVIRWNKSGKFLGCSAFPECRFTQSLTEPEEVGENCEKCGMSMVVKMGPRGKFVACSGYPDCRNTRPLYKGKRKVKIPEDFAEACEKCGETMAIKYGRRGGFIACSGYPNCKNTRSFPKEWYVTVEDTKPADDAPAKEAATEE